MLPLKIGFASLCLALGVGSVAHAAKKPKIIPGNRMATVLLSNDFLNEQLALRSKSDLVRGLAIKLDPRRDQIFLTGTVHIPVDEMRAINLDPKLGAYRFQIAVKLETTKHGHLIVEFPLNETYFYPADSTDQRDRVIIPVQMLSVALASIRGYLAALSGDFRGFDRRVEKLNALLKAMDRAIAEEKNPDAREDLQNQKESLRLQLAAVPIERRQLQSLAKELESVLSFTGEKELDLNHELAARKNALIFKIKISQLAPFLKGVELGGVRIVHDKKDGGGEDYLAIDINTKVEGEPPPDRVAIPAQREGMKIAPSLMLRLNQTLFESEAVRDAEKQKMGDKLKNFDLQLKDDGMHISGKWQALLFSIPFDTIVDLTSTGTDVFEARVRDIEVAGIDLEFLSKFALEALQSRLEETLRGMCAFRYVGEEKDGARALEVRILPKALIPAFPFLHLLRVDVRDKELLVKMGRVAGVE